MSAPVALRPIWTGFGRLGELTVDAAGRHRLEHIAEVPIGRVGSPQWGSGRWNRCNQESVPSTLVLNSGRVPGTDAPRLCADKELHA